MREKKKSDVNRTESFLLLFYLCFLLVLSRRKMLERKVIYTFPRIFKLLEFILCAFVKFSKFTKKISFYIKIIAKINQFIPY